MIQKTAILWPRPLSRLAIVAAVAATLLGGCNETEPPTASSDPVTPTPVPEAIEPVPEDTTVATPPDTPTPDDSNQNDPPSGNVGLTNKTVSEQGLGVAQLGMALEDLKTALPDLDFIPQSPFIVDFDAIAVRQGEETLFYILHLAGNPLTDEDPIQGLVTDHPMFRTAEDVGVGTPINAAEVPYGKAVLSYNTGNESREYVRFENHPAPNISFGTQKKVVSEDDPSSGLAGIYATPTPQYNETDEYQPDAAIEAILIVCLSATCSE